MLPMGVINNSLAYAIGQDVKNDRNAQNDVAYNLLVMFWLADLKTTQLELKWLEPKWFGKSATSATLY